MQILQTITSYRTHGFAKYVKFYFLQNLKVTCNRQNCDVMFAKLRIKNNLSPLTRMHNYLQ